MKTALSSILIIAVLAGAPGFAQQADLSKDRVLLPGRAGVLSKDRVLPAGRAGVLSKDRVLPAGRAGVLSKEKVLYAVGYAHLDTEWRWDYQATIDQYIWNTMADNFRLIEKYPDYVFNFSGANRYRMMKEYYPQEFERVKRLAAQGRWFPAGSSMEENDALAPSYESVIRQVLMGSNYFRKELGVSSEEYMLPDCFGFPASLPSILAHCGLKGFSTQKLSWGSARGIPFNVGLWVGPDGESVIAALNPGAYVTQVKEDLSVNPEWTKRIETQGAKYGVFADYMYFGTGDVGGAPTEESVKWVEKSRESARNFKVVSAKADQLFKDLTPDEKAALPTTSGEFLLTNHSAGSITSAAFMKRLNRKNEFLGVQAEAASVMGEWLGGAAYDRERLAEAWRLVLGSQFHDILPGTSIPKAYEYAWNDGLLAANEFGHVLAGASGAVVRALNTRAAGVALAVFNPMAAVREDAVEAEVPFPAGAPKAVRVYDGEGREVPSQVVETSADKVKVVFVAKVPSLGYAVFDVSPADSPCALDTGLKATGLSLENKRYTVRLGTDGDVVSIIDKTSKKELLAAPARLEFHYERPQDWPAWNMDWEDREKPASGYVEGPASVRIVENGPARVALEVVRESRHSKFVQKIRLAAAGGSDRVEFATSIDWATRESSLKAAFPLTVSNPIATYNFGVGTVERGNNDPAKFEVPSHEWFDLTDKDGSYGVSVLEDCKYGSDKPSDNTLRLTLLYTPGVRASYREQAVQDFGHHEVLYALYGHRGDWRIGDSGLQAARLNQPLVPFAAPAHPGPLGRSFSFLQVGGDNVVVSAVKKAEIGDDLIVRVVESKGRAAKGVTIAFAAPVVAAREVDGQERDLRPAVVKDGRLVFDITPYHLRTFAVRLQPFAGPLGTPEGVPVDLPFDMDVISADGHKADGDMDGLGASYPAEMMPDTVRSGDVLFKLGPKADGAANAVSCQGQTVRLPEGKFNRLYILAASAGRPDRRPREGAGGSAFKVGDKAVAVDVAGWSGYIGQWERRLWSGDKPPATDEELNAAEYAGLAPAFLRPDDVALFTTHRHARNGANEAYVYAYAYKYAIDMPAGARTVTLPDDRRVKVLAMTVAWNEDDATQPAAPLSDTLARDRGMFERFRACAKPVIVPEMAYVGYGSAVEVVMAAKDEGAVVHYTLDGSEPTEKSPAYSGPVKVDRTCVLKAAAFHPVRLPGASSVAYFSRSLPVKAVRYNIRPTSRRGAPIDMRALIDIRRASADNYAAWQWFSGTDLDVILDLGEMRTIEGVDLGCLENNRAWVFLPTEIEVSVSDDDRGYRAVFSRELGTPEKARPSGVADLKFDFTKTQARYIHLTAKNIGVLPKWHGSAGEKAWLAVDEIAIR